MRLGQVTHPKNDLRTYKQLSSGSEAGPRRLFSKPGREGVAAYDVRIGYTVRGFNLGHNCSWSSGARQRISYEAMQREIQGRCASMSQLDPDSRHRWSPNQRYAFANPPCATSRYWAFVASGNDRSEVLVIKQRGDIGGRDCL